MAYAAVFFQVILAQQPLHHCGMRSTRVRGCGRLEYELSRSTVRARHPCDVRLFVFTVPVVVLVRVARTNGVRDDVSPGDSSETAATAA
jgi:hypothetical protein